jgi:hypothetical protein
LFFISLAAILLQAFSKGIILLSFEVNQDFIANNFCVQKDVEDNCCKGSCQLKKQLSDDEAKSESIPFQNLKDKLDVHLFCEAETLYVFSPKAADKTLLRYRHSALLDSESTVLHPPPQA